MSLEEHPTEEFLSRLAEQARERGEESVVVEVGRDVAALWLAVGFRERARVLEAPVVALERRLASAKGPSFGSIHVQTDDVDGAVRAVRQYLPRMPGSSKGSVVAPPRNGWVAVYDELGDRNPEMLRRLARELSDRMGAVVLLLGVEEGAVVRFVLFERGRIMDEYLSVPTYHGEVPPGDVIALQANPTVVARLTGADPATVRQVVRTAGAPDELPAAAELVREVARVLGVEGAEHGYVGAEAVPGALALSRE
ncbi:MAG TPA: hypothetical protein VE693_02100 [Gaiellaceae bacterium]|jgi:hypothetical protein|nr:hypothetical protein [Gaiellaceae bacterium]